MMTSLFQFYRQAGIPNLPRRQHQFLKSSRRLLLHGCRLISILLQYAAVPWYLQKILLWILAQWTVCRVVLNSHTQRFRRLLAIFQTLHLPSEFTWDWRNSTNVVYMRLHFDNGQFYIGCTETDVFHREQSRLRKYRQLCSGHLGYFEPALKLWYRLRNFYEFAIFPTHQCDTTMLLAMEASFQQTLRPQWNWPWINPLLKKWHIGRQQFGLPQAESHRLTGKKLLRRYLRRSKSTQISYLAHRLNDNTQIFAFLYMLGSDTRSKFDCSRLLHSARAVTAYCYLLGACVEL